MSDTSRINIHIDPDIRELIPRFLDGRRKEITDIPDLIKLKDFAAIQTIGHKLKGNGAGYGFEKLSDIGKNIEIAAREQNKVQIEQCLIEMTDYLERIDIIYDG